MDPDPIRLAVIGAGWAGMRQVDAIAELDGRFEIAALVDLDADFAHRQAADRDIPKVYTDAQMALNDSDVDAVSVCLPHHLHATMSIAACEAGKHVLVEKPMAMNVDEGNSMIQSALDNDVVLFVAESSVYEPMTLYLDEIVASGAHIGEVTFASVTSGFRAPDVRYPGRRSWLTDPDRGGTGMWMLQGIQTVARLRYILGEVRSVYMTEHKATSFKRQDLEGTMSGLLTLDSGVAVWVVQTTESWLPGRLEGWRIHGDEGSILADANGFEILSETLTRERFGVSAPSNAAGVAGQHGEQFPHRPEIRPVSMSYPSMELSEYAMELGAFADLIQGIGTGPTTAASELQSLAVVQAGYESSAGGAVVDMQRRFPELY